MEDDGKLGQFVVPASKKLNRTHVSATPSIPTCLIAAWAMQRLPSVIYCIERKLEIGPNKRTGGTHAVTQPPDIRHCTFI
jgi:hypothetical protein